MKDEQLQTRGASALAVRIAASMTLVVMVAAFIVMAFAQYIVISHYASAELRMVENNRTLLQRLLDVEFDHLRTVTRDWGQWDGLYGFATGTNPEFAPAEMGDRVLERLKLDIVMVLDTQGRIVRADTRPAPAGAGRQTVASIAAAFLSAADEPAYSDSIEATGPHAGLLDTDLGPMVVSGQPILRTDGSGPVAGTLVTGRRLQLVEVFGALSAVRSVVSINRIDPSGDAELAPIIARLVADGSGALLVTADDTLSDFQLLRDLTGEPAFLLESRTHRNIVAAGQEMTSALLTVILVVALAAVLIVIALIQRSVAAPLGRLSRHMLSLRDSADPTPAPGHERNDEIGRLARCFDELIGRIHDNRQRLERFAAALEHAGDAIAILDANGRIEYVNPRYEAQTGYSREEVEGRLPGRSRQDNYDELWTTVRSGKVWSGRLNAVHRDGTPMQEEVTIAPISAPDGRVISFVAVMRDITKQQNREAQIRRLATLVEHAADAIVVLSPAGRIEYVNPAFERSRDVSSDDALGCTPGELMVGCDEPDYYRRMRGASRAGQVWSGRIRTKSRDGRTLTETAVVSPIVQEDGSHSGYALILHDLTRSENLEAQLAEARRLEAVGRLAAGVAHEINTPTQYVGDNIRFLQDAFNEIGGMLQGLHELAHEPGMVDQPTLVAHLQKCDLRYFGTEVPAAIRQSLEGVERVTGIVQSMKELSHPARDLEPADLNRIVEMAVSMTAKEWKPVAALAMDLDPELPMVPCQAVGISQVVVNLVVNAAQAIGEHQRGAAAPPGVITIRTRCDGDDVEIEISDNGPGMADDVRERLFEPFFTTKPVSRGTGQGLPIARSIMLNHGGGIRVDTAPGAGAHFIVHLPKARPSRQAA